MTTSTPSLSGALVPFRIFISSPGDVSEERALCHQVVTRLQQYKLFRDRFALFSVAWDKEGVEIPMRYTETPQLSVNRTIGKPSECDVVVVILWGKLGTPLPGRHVKADGSLYRSGTEWEFEDALQAHREHGSPQILVYRRPDQPPLKRQDTDFKKKLYQQEAVEAFFAGTVDAQTGAILHGVNTYQEPNEFELQFHEHLRQLLEERLDQLPALAEGTAQAPVATPARFERPPFPGLRTFLEEDEPVFFGRGREIDRVIEALRQADRRLLAVVGASGSGKSSLVRAGVIPRLKRGAIPGSERWLYLKPLKPSDYQQSPLLALAARLEPHLPGREAGELAQILEKDHRAFGKLVARALASHSDAEDTEFLWVVDQFEELFTVVEDETRREGFLALLTAASEQARVRTLISARADFLRRGLDAPGFGPVLTNNTFLLGAPDRRGLYEMIEGPARVVGCRFVPEVIDAVVGDVCGTSGFPEAGSLPLLAYALGRLYDQRDQAREQVTMRAYYELGQHGVKGAIGEHAEEVFARLPAEVQQAFECVFRELVQVNDKGPDTRKRASPAAFAEEPAAWQLVEVLSGAKPYDKASGLKTYLLVTTDEGEFEVAHEALFQHWSRLNGWLERAREALLLRDQVEQAAAQWAEARQRPEADRLEKTYRWDDARVLKTVLDMTAGGLELSSLSDLARAFVGPTDRETLEALPGLSRTEDVATGSGRYGALWRLPLGHAARAKCGVRLALLEGGDRRPGVGLREDGLPDFAWCPIEKAAQVTIEIRADPRYPDSEVVKQIAQRVDAFKIARYPVTIAQFQAFVQACYRDGEWRLPAGFRWAFWNTWAAPRHRAEYPNHPADSVNWFDALAFCHWLTDRYRSADLLGSDEVIRLPTEFEWQLAATGGKADRKYPWGPNWDPVEEPWRANTYESDLGRSTAVGLYPRGASPVDALDMAGNVWEWCLNPFEYEDPDDLALDDVDTDRVLRGGSWFGDQYLCRAACRSRYDPLDRYSSFGFRLCLSSPIVDD